MDLVRFLKNAKTEEGQHQIGDLNLAIVRETSRVIYYSKNISTYSFSYYVRSFEL